LRRDICIPSSLSKKRRRSNCRIVQNELPHVCVRDGKSSESNGLVLGGFALPGSTIPQKQVPQKPAIARRSCAPVNPYLFMQKIFPLVNLEPFMRWNESDRTQMGKSQKSYCLQIRFVIREYRTFMIARQNPILLRRIAILGIVLASLQTSPFTQVFCCKLSSSREAEHDTLPLVRTFSSSPCYLKARPGERGRNISLPMCYSDGIQHPKTYS
jgi:hypothetical protein